MSLVDVFKDNDNIKVITTEEGVRSLRSKLISFYCPICNSMYIDVLHTKIGTFIDNNIICRKCLDDCSKE